MIPLHSVALILALGLTPWFIARLILPRSSLPATLAVWGPVMVAWNIAVPVSLHCLGIPLTPTTLATTHVFSGIPITLSGWFASRRQTLSLGDIPRLLCIAAALFAVLVLPVTHIAGIDTYKWQDLAGTVPVEERIAWLVHPLSLLGFTPRSYPSAQPLVLATIEMLGHTGVDWGFTILSITFGIAGLFGAWLLGRRLFESADQAAWFAFLYVFSPVFMRYNYWATGRGLLMALLPLYILALLRISTVRGALSILPLALLLALAHKAGLVAAILIPLLFLVSPGLALLRGRWGMLILLGLTVAGGLLLAGGHSLDAAIRMATRFGFLAPLAVFALVAAPARFGGATARALLAGGAATLILSCAADMYGALIALPFVAYVSVIGLERIARFVPAFFMLTLATAGVIVVNQALDSPNESVYQAAQFLERHDPTGPYRVEAPGRARAQIQAYVSGCPRFTIQAGTTGAIAVHPPPKWTGHPGRDARVWIAYLRTVLEVPDMTTDWYGQDTRTYFVTVEGKGTVPPGAKPLFTAGNVTVFSRP